MLVIDTPPIDYTSLIAGIREGFRSYHEQKLRLMGCAKPLFLFKVIKHCPGTDASASIFLDIVETLLAYCIKVNITYHTLLHEVVNEVIETIGNDFEFFVAFFDHCSYHTIDLHHLFKKYVDEGYWHFAEYILASRRLEIRWNFFSFMKDYSYDKFIIVESGIGASLSIDDYVQIFVSVLSGKVYSYIYSKYLSHLKNNVYSAYGVKLLTFLIDRALFHNNLEKVLFLLEQGALPSIGSDLEDFIYYLIRQNNDEEPIFLLLRVLSNHFGNESISHVCNIIKNDERHLHWIDKINNQFNFIDDQVVFNIE